MGDASLAASKDFTAHFCLQPRHLRTRGDRLLEPPPPDRRVLDVLGKAK